MTVAERTALSVETIASITRCRSALDQATILQSTSPAPVMVDLENLRDCGQPFSHRIVATCLADLEGDERGHLVAQRGRIHVGSVPGYHAAILQSLQAGLHGAAGDA
jgi:hypothetical protein